MKHYLPTNNSKADSVSNTQIVIPEIIHNIKNPEQVIGLSYHTNGKRYYFSNSDGHKVFSSGSQSCRPMTKKEFKDICLQMLENSNHYGEIEETVLSTIESLDFGLGHANSTFEVAISWCEPTKISALVMNIGTSRYLYNQDANTIFHVDHSKLVNGEMLRSPFKEQIIEKIQTSKTMAKKINQAFNH